MQVEIGSHGLWESKAHKLQIGNCCPQVIFSLHCQAMQKDQGRWEEEAEALDM